MKRTFVMMVVSAGLLLGSACSSDELQTPTGVEAGRTLQGQVIPIGINGADGVLVSALGSGMSAVTDSEGRFALTAVPESVSTLRFTRGDGIDATLDLPGTVSALVIELSQNRASSRRRAMSRPEGAAPGAAQQAEGRVVSLTADALVVSTMNGVEWTFTMTDATVIRKGNQTFDASVLVAGTRVHVRAALDEARTALEIKLRGDDGDDEGDDEGEDEGTPTRTANGIVSAVGESDLTVETADGRTILVMVDENTRIQRRGATIALSDIEVDDRVEAKGEGVDELTILAKKIVTQDR